MEGRTRRHICAISLLLTVALPTAALAQTTTSESGSNAAANSGSASQAASESNPTNINNPVNHQGNLTSTSGSNATANSGSVSGSNSNQNQAQDSYNAQGQTQAQNQMQGQTASNSQGVNLTFNSTTPRTQKFYTNNAVPLAASSSFSSDYCGGTASGGASAAPIGISIGGSGPVFDKSCQSLRRAEKFGMAAANASNMGQPELAGRLMSMMIWSICTSDSGGPKPDKATAQACDAIGLLGSTASSQPEPARAPEPMTQTPAGYPTPEASTRDTPQVSASVDVTANPPQVASAPRIEMAAVK